MLTRNQRRRLSMGLSTLLGLRTFGFFLPYRYAASVRPTAYDGLRPLFAKAEPAFIDLISKIHALAPAIHALPKSAAGARFDQSWFPGLDALAAYAMVRTWKPRRIVEVGSGHSTRFMAAAIHDGMLETSLICIDPAPRATLAHLPVTWRQSVLQEAPLTDIEALQAGDVLFVDSSHLLMPGTDVDFLIGSILPALRPGVHLHLHDIFLPDPYPQDWSWRGYNEQGAIAALLQGGGYRLVFSSRYVATNMSERIGLVTFKDLGIAESGLESSLWLQKHHARIETTSFVSRS